MSSPQPKNSVPYMALYRRWRPQLFSQIVGQEHVTRTLRNALSSSRVAHAYLFCGLRGTGKTTMAKLLAKALNCERGITEEPCNICRSCREINEGHSLDVIEIDAASNRGIDEIRDLREKVRYAAASSRYKVYIIDEVHMLTNEAFNALLKTLEEPPPNVVFILATTEVHKLPLTVVSRCQRFEFHLIGAAPLASHLARIAGEMNFSIDEATCTLLARLAEGSARDALGLLEQCRAYGGDGVDHEGALEILGIAHPEMIHRLFDSVAAGNIGEGLTILGNVVSRGKDVHRLLRELILYLRKLLMLQSGENMEQFLEDVPGFRSYLLEHRQIFNHQVLLEMLEIMQQLSMQMKGASQPQFLLELAFLRLVRVFRFRNYFSPEALFSRLEELESKLEAAGLALAEPGPGPGMQDLPPWEPMEQAPLVSGGAGYKDGGSDRDGISVGETDNKKDKGNAGTGGIGGINGMDRIDHINHIEDRDSVYAGKKDDDGTVAGIGVKAAPGDGEGAGGKGAAPVKKTVGPAGESIPAAEAAEQRIGREPSFKGLMSSKGRKKILTDEPPPLPEPPPPEEGDELPPAELPPARPSLPPDDTFLRQMLDLFQGRLIDS